VTVGGQWAEALTEALTTGETTIKEVYALLRTLARSKPGQRPPEWHEVEAVALAYRERGHKYRTQTAFAKTVGCSLATLHRYLDVYEATTGQRLRPGQGRAKRRSN